MTTKVVAIDDHPIVVEGLMALLAREDPTFELVQSASGWPDLKGTLTQSLRPDLALLDLHRNDGTQPADAVSGLVPHGIPVVILTSELRPVPIRQMVQAGALGLVLKSDPVEQILDVMRAALAGEFECSSDLAFVLVTDPDAHAHLAAREIEALSLLAEGWPRKLIGAQMHPPVAMATVVTYLNRAVQRYRDLGRGVVTPGDAARAATEDGWLDIPETPIVRRTTH